MKKFLTILLAVGMLLSCFDGLAIDNYGESRGEFTIDLTDRSFALEPIKLSGSYTNKYYDQLSNNEKFFYDARMDSIPVIKKGEVDEYEFNVFFEISTDDFIPAFFNAAFAFDFDRPDIFWLNKTVKVSYTYNAIDNLVTKVRIMKPDDGWYNAYSTNAEVVAAEGVFENKVRELLAAAPSSNLSNVKFFHDWLVTNNEYNTFVAEGDMDSASPLAWSAASALIGNPNSLQDDPVCEGYARALKVLLDRSSTQCALISGDGNGGPHMWCYVKMNDAKWYAVDVTWDDAYQGNEVSYRYFLKGSAVFFRDHTESGIIAGYGPYSYPQISQEDYPFDPNPDIGDVNMDGDLNTGDAAILLQYFANLESLDGKCMEVSDYNGDGETNTGDASSILRYVAFGQ